MIRKLSIGCVFAFLATGCQDDPSSERASASVETQPSTDSHLLLTVEYGPEGARVLDSRVVPLPLPKRRGPNTLPWRVTLKNAQGQVRYSAAVPAANVVRAEFREPGKRATTGTSFAESHFAVGLRLPLLSDVALVALWGATDTLSPDLRRKTADADGRMLIHEVAYPQGVRP